MADFAAKYINANLAQDAPAYDRARFLAWNEKLHKVQPSTQNGFTIGLLSAMLCAQRRGDAAAALFRDATKDESDADLVECFTIVREILALVAPFVGLPSCMPATFGLVGELRSRGINEVPCQNRLGFDKYDYTTEGRVSLKKIYRGVGNGEVDVMMQQYFPEMSYYAHTAVFGYMLSGGNLLSLKEKELVVASGILAQGAVRQSQSHCKASIQLGNRVEVVQELVDVSVEIGIWNNSPLSGLDVPQLAEEVKRNLTTEGQ